MHNSQLDAAREVPIARSGGSDQSVERTSTIIPILLYHSVAEDPPDWLAEFTVTPRQFEAQLSLIREIGRVPVSISALVNGLRAGVVPAGAMAITFDDGHADFMFEAAPRLTKASLPSTLYVTTGGLEGRGPKARLRVPRSKMLDWSSLSSLEKDGVEIGSHSHTHPQLDTLSVAASTEEVVRSKDLLEEVLGHRVGSFAYPHGYSNRRLREFVAQVGFDSACGVREALSTLSDDPYNLARLTVRNDTPLERIESWLAGTGAPIADPRERVTTTIWRWYRRVKELQRETVGKR